MLTTVPAILIVDDREQQRLSLKDQLAGEAPSWSIEVAADEEQGLRIFRERFASGKPFSVVISDLVMEDDTESGSRLIRAVQAIDPLVMTIVYTGYPELLDGLDTSGWGAFDVIVKLRGDAGEAGRKIIAKTQAAIKYRDWAVRLDLLRRYFDPTIYETIKRDESLLQPSTRWVTTAFWDIRGFSGLCGQLLEDPNLIADFLRQYCELAAKTIFDNNGILDKFIGDGVMALFGALDSGIESRSEAAVAAVKTAIRLQHRFGELLEDWMPKWKSHTTHRISISLGCGMHTGRAIVGNLGTAFRDQFTAVGATVNFAQRIESMASHDPGTEVLVSQTTASLIENVIPVVHYRDVSDVKNISGTHPIYRVDIPKYIDRFGPMNRSHPAGR